MSAKKKEKNSWIHCDQCNQNYVSKTKHLCGADEPFVKDKVFKGYLKIYHDTTGEKLPNAKQNFILVNQSTLKVCNFQVASSVVIRCGEQKTYGTLWPSSSVALNDINMSQSKLKSISSTPGNLAVVEKVELPSVIADSVTVKVLNSGVEYSSKDFDELKLLLADELDNACISIGDVTGVMLNGIPVNLVISTVMCDLDYELSKLSLAESEMSSPYLFLLNHTEIQISRPKSVDIEKDTVIVTETVIIARGQVGGLSKQVQYLNDLIKVPFATPNLFCDYGIVFPKGLILHGPSGTGKTLLANNYLQQLPSVFTTVINGPELTSKYFGETEEKLRSIFLDAISKVPSVLLIDEFDTVCPKRSGSSNESEKRIVATLCTLMDSIPNNVSFVVLALTNKIDEIDPALRRPGRFEKEIEFAVPNVEERHEILKCLVSNLKHCMVDDDLYHLAAITHGYVGADLSALCKEAGSCFLKEANNAQSPQSSLKIVLKDRLITLKNFKEALCHVCPSALKAMTVDVPKVFWCDVGGQDEVKQKLKEAVEWPLKHPRAFSRLGIKPPRGLLMYGPPGCSKTMMAKALATESSLNFISIKGPELFNKYLGESERAVREVFRKARLSAPSIVFFDEIDALGVQRTGKENGSGDKVLAQLLTELDGVESLNGVIVIAATNRPDIIDPALVRPGRIDRMIYVPLPNAKTRQEIFEIQFRTMPIENTVNVQSLVSLTEGYSGAELCSVCHEAGLIALRENIEATIVQKKHFITAINQVKPGTTQETISFYDDFANK